MIRIHMCRTVQAALRSLTSSMRVLAIALVVAGLLSLPLPAPASGASPACVPKWTRVPTPNVASSGNILTGVAATSASNAWAVGSYTNLDWSRTLILHWNGTRWTRVASPNPGGASQWNYLHGVAATSASNAWAVGTYYSGTARRTLILHWNGTHWTKVASPNPGGSSNDNFLTGVAATSASNAWAVGSTAGQTLILHWNGTRWTRVASPNPGGGGSLNGVATTSALNAWAVGSYYDGTASRTLVLQWNGRRWTKVASPDAGDSAIAYYLTGVAALSASNAWAVGGRSYHYDNDEGEGYTWTQTLILRWDGTGWAEVASPNPGGDFNENNLTGVAATSASNAWAVGSYYNGTAWRTLTLHWNGTRWTRVASPSPGGDHAYNFLTGVGATSASNAWAVGYTNDMERTLAIRWH